MSPTAGGVRPRLLVLTSTFPRWAGDREPPFVYELSRRLTEQFEVHVLTPHAPGARREETLDGVHVHRFRYAPERLQQLAYDGGILARLRERPWRLLLVPCLLAAQAWALRRLLARQRFDVLHAHWIIPQGLAALLAGAPRRVPMLCTSHGGDLFGLRGPLATHLKRRVLAQSAAVTVVSEAMREAVLALRPGRVVDVVPMGTDLGGCFTPPEQPARAPDTLLFAGRLVEKKGVVHLLDAVARLRATGRAVTLIIAGDGPLRGALQTHAAQLGIGAHVTFMGAVEHTRLAGLFQQAAVAVVPSVVAVDGDQEGFGLVIVEAMGCACPVVASRLPAINDIALDGETALLVPPADADALASAIARVLDDTDGAAQRAAAARVRVLERFGWESVSRRYADLLDRLARSGERVSETKV
ncbi:MAG: glycosyltransferase [Immundisolibacter sp.]|uniref:glycosyltransferase n=1 Tax=Immundisolibacter sp. TaxID=1934948 RepID=UPI003D11E808